MYCIKHFIIPHFRAYALYQRSSCGGKGDKLFEWALNVFCPSSYAKRLISHLHILGWLVEFNGKWGRTGQRVQTQGKKPKQTWTCQQERAVKSCITGNKIQRKSDSYQVWRQRKHKLNREHSQKSCIETM